MSFRQWCLVLADSIQCSVHHKKLRWNEIFLYEKYDLPMVWVHHHPTESTNLAWLPPENQIHHSPAIGSTNGRKTIKILRFPVPGISNKGISGTIATVPFDQDLFVPLRLEGSPRERQLIEVGFEWDDCVSPLRVAAPVGKVWNYAAWNMLMNGEEKSRVIITQFNQQIWLLTKSLMAPLLGSPSSADEEFYPLEFSLLPSEMKCLTTSSRRFVSFARHNNWSVDTNRNFVNGVTMPSRQGSEAAWAYRYPIAGAKKTIRS